MEAITIAEFLSEIGTFFTQSLTWLRSVLGVVSSNAPLTVLVLAIPIVGFSVGLLGRLIRL